MRSLFGRWFLVITLILIVVIFSAVGIASYYRVHYINFDIAVENAETLVIERVDEHGNVIPISGKKVGDIKPIGLTWWPNGGRGTVLNLPVPGRYLVSRLISGGEKEKITTIFFDKGAVRYDYLLTVSKDGISILTVEIKK
ncbi:MAG: hypothetical protein A3G49_04300 [Candidatus Sungbacteria bacterium RIFCSPLOWO2_12_FULL_41_11]|uniref:Uncharacterized protein n=1 Tax=Candidatus Sungbacteria bacterium RIFCSPLOWO2_12_FULL_41_11 TaxID=1802286 RepID=A0A1G2LTB7_9BACT|nr:MAG: hypothetical protein UV01_C0010G0007 [Parcubacteria group bacterium GW2011_GWA2_42_14]OHA14880.1 MAG: hypothetical protein A3G49_04300 [Candidatus Sungbacteria bacterium RIFCSPLOWO2_12_FULL_41_11]